MIDVWQKCIKFAYKIALKLKFSRGSAPDPAGGLTAPPDPQLDFVPTDQVGRTGYFLPATALLSQHNRLVATSSMSLTSYHFYY